jgi:hypothetical protein
LRGNFGLRDVIVFFRDRLGFRERPALRLLNNLFVLQFRQFEIVEFQVAERRGLKSFIDSQKLVQRVAILVAWQAVAVLIVVVIVWIHCVFSYSL